MDDAITFLYALQLNASNDKKTEISGIPRKLSRRYKESTDGEEPAIK